MTQNCSFDSIIRESPCLFPHLLERFILMLLGRKIDCIFLPRNRPEELLLDLKREGLVKMCLKFCFLQGIGDSLFQVSVVLTFSLGVSRVIREERKGGTKW